MKLPAVKPKDFIKRIERLGFVHQRTTGSHMIYKDSKTGSRANVPFHLREIPKGTLLAILRESGIKREDIV